MAMRQLAGKAGELYVFAELLKRGIAPYVPLVDEGVDAVVRVSGGWTLDLQVKYSGGAGGKHPGWFQVGKIEPDKRMFILAIEAVDGEPGDVWVLPSAVFDAYATRPPKGSPRDLDLDGGTRKYGSRLRELLCGFKNRWELIVDYDKYEALMDSTEDLEDTLTMNDAQEAPIEEVITLEDYDRLRGTVRR
jgi:hypothetical protein